MEEDQSSLSADQPLDQPEADRLGYAQLAKHLAESIANLPSANGIVIALNGPWGSGKTTLLNFVEHFLRQAPGSEHIIVVTFNPWWFSGREDLTRRFFDQLSATLANRLKSASTVLRKRIAEFAAIVSDTPLPYASAGKAAAKVIAPKPKDVPQLKKELSELIRKQRKQMVIIIDDIDRLTAEEVRQLFRVVKAVGDFPNVTYLLAFDRQMVISALNSVQGTPGDAYLEKIVQLPIELPLPDKSGLEDMLLVRLNALLAGTPEGLFEQAYWNRVYLRGLAHFLATPRDVVRLANGLTVTYVAVKGEVNPVDFIAVEVLRLFCPEVYDTIRQNALIFARYPDSSLTDPAFKREHKAVIDAMLEQLPPHDREVVKTLLFLLFPRLEGLYGGVTYGSNWGTQWRKERRICSFDIFPTYFRLAVPEGTATRAEMQALLNLTSDPEALAARLQEYAFQRTPSGSTRLRAVLDQLQDYTGEEISQSNARHVLNALFRVADQLVDAPDIRRGLFDIENDVRLGRLTMQLLDRLEPGAECTALQDAIAQGTSIFFAVRTVVILGQEHGKYGSEPDPPHRRRHVSLEQLDDLEAIVLDKVREAAASGKLLSVPHLPSVLNWWREHGSNEDVQTWTTGVVSDESQLVTLLEQFGHETYSQTVGDVDANMHATYHIDPRELAPFVDPVIVAARLAGTTFDNLSESQARAAAAYVQAYDLMRQSKSSEQSGTQEED